LRAELIEKISGSDAGVGDALACSKFSGLLRWPQNEPMFDLVLELPVVGKRGRKRRCRNKRRGGVLRKEAIVSSEKEERHSSSHAHASGPQLVQELQRAARSVFREHSFDWLS
jgi:hypothetical protein